MGETFRIKTIAFLIRQGRSGGAGWNETKKRPSAQPLRTEIWQYVPEAM